MQFLLTISALVSVVAAVAAFDHPQALNGSATINNENVTQTDDQQRKAEVEARVEQESMINASSMLRGPPGAEVPTSPFTSFTLVVYGGVFITCVAMVYLVVRNFRSTYESTRGDRYGFRPLPNHRNHEAQPLSRDDDEEEILFDVRGSLR